MPPLLIENFLEFEEKLSLFGGKNLFPNRSMIWKYIINFLSSYNWSMDVAITDKFVEEVHKLIKTVIYN
jgi:hypothetical protein